MPKIKNTKHRVQIINLPDGFELIDGELVKKAHGGNVTGDQSNYGLVTYNSNGNYQENEVEDTDVRYSLSSVPRDVANIEAEGGETVLTDLSNDGNFGLYDITGPRHSKGGVPMYLPEQSFIFSDTDKMKMGGEELSEFGIQSKKKMTPAKVSKKFDLNRYYGLLNDEYTDKIQAESAELMLTKNSETLSKLAFGQELRKDFEEGVPVASHPYLKSIGLDPLEFTAQVEQRQQGQQPMNEADEQAMSAMQHGGSLPKAQFAGDPWNMIDALRQFMPAQTDQANYGPIDALSDPKFGQTANYADVQNLGSDLELQNKVANQSTSYEDPTVERMDDDRSWSERQGSKLDKGLDRFMDSPGMNNVGEVGKFAGALADSANSYFLDLKGKRAKNDLQRMTMADNAYATLESDNNGMGYWDTQTGLINQNMQGRGPSGFNGAYNQSKYGSELPKAQEGVEQLWKEGETYKGGSPEWNQWYMSDNASNYRGDRYKAYKALQDRDGVNALSEEDYHSLYIRGQNQINALNTNLTSDQLSEADWDQYRDSRRWHKEIGNINASRKKANEAALAAMSDEDREAALTANPDYLTQNQFIDFTGDDFQNFQQGYIGGIQMEQLRNVDNPDWAQQMTSTGVDDQFQMIDGVKVPLSGADKIGGNTTNREWENTTIPLTEKEKEIIEGCEDCPEGFRNKPTDEDPCACEEIPVLDQADEIEEKAPPVKAPWIQDVLKTNAIANRKRDMFFPWEPAQQRGRYEFALEDPTRQIAAINEQLNIGSRAAGTFGGPQALAARTSQAQGQAAGNIADAVGGVNSRNVATINQGNQIQSQLNDRFNTANAASKTRVFDNTQKVLQMSMDEQNFDREQYADAMANQITNASNTYNQNSIQDYYNIDPMRGGDIYQTGSKAFEAAPLANDYAAIDKAAEYAEHYTSKTGKQPTEAMMNAWMNLAGSSGQPNEKNWQREARVNQPYMSGYGGRKKGGAIKKWASPFYTGKMGV